MARNDRVPFGGRWFAIVNVESHVVAGPLYSDEKEALDDLTRRQALPEDDDNRATPECVVLSCDIAGALWNRYDPDPRADRPLTPEEIGAVHDGREVE